MEIEPQEPVASVPPGVEALLERVLAGPTINRSPRLRELLAFLCDWSLNHNGAPLTEERIGVEVFSRQAGYDTTSDTIVRVQISQLRKKLEQHFQTDGAHEPVVIELPKRTYAAVFRPRHQPVEPLPEAVEAPPARGRRLPLVLAALLALSLAAVGWLAVDNARLRRGASGQPLSDRFLTQAFGGRPVQLVVSDGATMAINNHLSSLVTPLEYRSPGFPANVLDRRSTAPEHRAALNLLMGMHLTTLQDVQIASQLMQRTVALGIPSSIVYARDFRFLPQSPENLILLGHRKANPWTAVFEERLNFQYAYDPPTRKSWIVNKSPAAGEQAIYETTFGLQGYAVVALLPKPGGEGAVLLLEGGDMGSPLAASALVCRDDRLAELYRQLGVRRGDPLPWFEALIRTHLLGNIVHSAEIVAHRLK